MATRHSGEVGTQCSTESVIINLTQRSRQMMKHIVRFMQEDEGTTAVEYGLMLALISAALIAAVQLLGTNLTTRFNAVAATILAS